VGEILVFTDSDCVVEDGWLVEMVRPFSDHEVVGVQGCYKTRQRGWMARFVQYEIEERYGRMSRYRYIDFIGTYSAAYRRDVFMRGGAFDESFPLASGEDPELSFRLSDMGYKMVFNPMAVVYHFHPDTLRKYLRQKFYRAYWRVAVYKRNPRRIKGETYTPPTLSLHIAFTYISLLIGPFYPYILLFLLLSTMPFTIRVAGREKKYLLLSPPIVILRNIVFGLGIMYGLIKIREKRYPRVNLILSRIRGKILDVGHSSGTLHEVLRRSSPNVFGLDIKEKKVENSIVGDAQNMAIKDEIFEFVVAGEIIEHLRNPELFLRECFRVTKQGGTCVITTPNKRSWVNRLTKSYVTDVHLSLFDEESLVRLCQKCGFRIKEVKYLPYTKESSEGSNYPYFFRLRGIIHKLVPDSMREEIIVVCEK
jgi:SAM-dependent methyltransferase